MYLNRREIVLVFCSSCFLLNACSQSGYRPKAAISASPTRTAAATGAAKDGWWIKIRKEKQESPTITFFIGSNNHTVESWKTWNSGDPLEFDVPDKFKNINPLYIKAQSSGGRNSWFCMMYKDAGVKHFDFDDDEDHEEKQTDRDGECNFSN